MSEIIDLTKNSIGNCKFMEHVFFWKIYILYYPNTIRSHLVPIIVFIPMAPFTPKSTLKLRSALHIRYSIVIPLFISRANTAQA